MMLQLKLLPKHGSLVEPYVDLGTIYAEAAIEFKARAQEDRLQILKSLEVQAAPDAVVSKSPDVQNPQNKRPMSEPAPHTPDVQHPQNKRPMSEPAFDTPDALYCLDTLRYPSDSRRRAGGFEISLLFCSGRLRRRRSNAAWCLGGGSHDFGVAGSSA